MAIRITNGGRDDGRCWLWDQRTNLLHLTIDNYFSFPIVTLCGQPVGVNWQVSTVRLGPGPNCTACERRARPIRHADDQELADMGFSS